MLAENEIVREAVRCFRRLLEPRAHLRSLDTYLAKDRGWGVFVARNNYSKPVARVSAEVFRGFESNDWVVRDGDDRARLSEAGASWLKRRIGRDAYLEQHQERVVREVEDPSGGRVEVKVNVSESPLSWMRNRKDARGEPLLTTEQYEAGERLRRDFEQAQLKPHVTTNWDFDMAGGRTAGHAAGEATPSEAAIAAKRRLFGALDAVGPELACLLDEVCCQLNGLCDAEHKLGLPKRSGKAVLRIGLNALARHYGLLETPSFARSGLRALAMPGYRPVL